MGWSSVAEYILYQQMLAGPASAGRKKDLNPAFHGCFATHGYYWMVPLRGTFLYSGLPTSDFNHDNPTIPHSLSRLFGMREQPDNISLLSLSLTHDPRNPLKSV